MNPVKRLTKDDAAKLGLRVLELVEPKTLADSDCRLAVITFEFDRRGAIPVFVHLDMSNNRFESYDYAAYSFTASNNMRRVTLKSGIIGSAIHDICVAAGLKNKGNDVNFGFETFSVSKKEMNLSAAINNTADGVVKCYTGAVLGAKNKTYAYQGFPERFPDKRVLFSLIIRVHRRNLDTSDDETASDDEAALKDETAFAEMFSPTEPIFFAVTDTSKFTINPFKLREAPSAVATSIHGPQSANQG